MQQRAGLILSFASLCLVLIGCQQPGEVVERASDRQADSDLPPPGLAGAGRKILDEHDDGGVDNAPDAVSVAMEPPRRLSVGDLSIEASIVPVGLNPNGAMHIPDDVTQVGWYDPAGGGVRPGSAGTAVIAGHVNSRTQGSGVLSDLVDAQPGMAVTVHHADGAVSSWVVDNVEVINKNQMPLHDIFVWHGPPQLVLITCTGPWDGAEARYRDNLVVSAMPAGS